MSTVCAKIIPVVVIGKARFNTNYSIVEDALFMATISKEISVFRTAHSTATYYRRVRPDSASRPIEFVKKVKITKQYIKLLFVFVYIYFHSPFRYNPIFFATRLVAILRNIFRLLLK